MSCVLTRLGAVLSLLAGLTLATVGCIGSPQPEPPTQGDLDAGAGVRFDGAAPAIDAGGAVADGGAVVDAGADAGAAMDGGGPSDGGGGPVISPPPLIPPDRPGPSPSPAPLPASDSPDAGGR